MKRLVPVLLVSALVAACGDSTQSDGQAPAGGAGIESEEIVPGSGTSGDDASPVSTGAATEPDPAAPEAVESSTVDDTTPSATDPSDTEPVDTEPPAAEPEPTDPPSTEPAPPNAPTDRVVPFYAGDSSAGSPWAPLGWWDGSNWREVAFSDSGEELPLPDPPIDSVSVSSLDLPDGPSAVIDGLAFGERVPYCVGEESGPLVDLPVDLPETPVSVGYDAVAVAADWPLQPRDVRQVGLEVPVYATVGATLLTDQVANAGEGSVVQVVRVDLDGNGVEEVLVTYELQVAGDFGGEGDFTSIYVRYPSSDGSVVDELLVSYASSEPVDFPTPGRFTLAAVADLNGDGVMEVMVRDRFWESSGMQVFALVDDRLTRVAGGGCGV